MSTTGIIDRVLPWCPGWERSSGRKNLLKVLQQGVDMLFNFDDDCMIYRDTDNRGFPPYLITVAGTYRYSITPLNLSCSSITRNIGDASYNLTARKVNRIFIDTTSTSAEYFDSWTGIPFRLNINPYNIGWQDRLYIAISQVSSQLGYENTPPYVDFQSDPGSHSDKFFCEFYVGAPRLLSESIQIPLPVEYEEALEDYVIGFVQKRESGRTNDNLERFKNEMIPKFRDDIRTAANTVEPYTPARFC
jgi:hypothetical protein